jgi:hypothetical protein
MRRDPGAIGLVYCDKLSAMCRPSCWRVLLLTDSTFSNSGSEQRRRSANSRERAADRPDGTRKIVHSYSFSRLPVDHHRQCVVISGSRRQPAYLPPPSIMTEIIYNEMTKEE